MKQFILLFLFLLPFFSFAQNQVDLYFFYSETCPHCKKIEPKLEEWQKEYNLNVKKFEISENKANREIFLRLGFDSVPTIMVNDKTFVGDQEATLTQLEEEIKYCQENQCVSPEERIQQSPQKTTNKKVFYVLGITGGVVLLIIIFSLFRRK